MIVLHIRGYYDEPNDTVAFPGLCFTLLFYLNINVKISNVVSRINLM